MQREKFRQTRVLSGVDYTIDEFTPRNVNFGGKIVFVLSETKQQQIES
jgi:hypothetical protein